MYDYLKLFFREKKEMNINLGIDFLKRRIEKFKPIETIDYLEFKREFVY